MTVEADGVMYEALSNLFDSNGIPAACICNNAAAMTFSKFYQSLSFFQAQVY